MKVYQEYIQNIFKAGQAKPLIITHKKEQKMKKQLEGQINLFDIFTSEESENSQKSEEVEKDGNQYFKECKLCWCFDCRHNVLNEGVPRDFMGEYKPCPSCTFCIDRNKADPCEIGSYDNGCKVRSEEEGI